MNFSASYMRRLKRPFEREVEKGRVGDLTQRLLWSVTTNATLVSVKIPEKVGHDVYDL